MNVQTRHLTSWQDEVTMLQDAVIRLADARRPLEILEAGCGRMWELELGEVAFRLTGIDLDPAALEIRKNQLADLDVAILGDLRTAEFEEQSFDVVYNSYVLEHIEGAEIVLNKLCTWVKCGGIVIIRIPDPGSVKGFFTRLTPQWVHVLYHRHVRHSPNAGKPGFPPYPTLFDRVLFRDRFVEFCARRGMTILLEAHDGYYNLGPGLLGRLARRFSDLVSLLSLGRLSSRHTNTIYILERPQSGAVAPTTEAAR